MKAESTIKKMISRLRRVSEDETRSRNERDWAYESYHALRWVVEDVHWTPASFFERPKAQQAGGQDDE